MKFANKNKWLIFVLLIWAVIFCVPPLRYQLKVMAKGSPWIRFTIFPNHYLDARFGLNSPELPLQVEAIKGGVDAFEWPNNFETLNKLDQLIQKNPNVPWLIALRLEVTTTVFQKNRVGGELSDGRLSEHLKAGILSPETNGEKVNFTPEQMKQTLALCRQGEKLEPQNAFFSWMRAGFLLINWQDKEAWQALEEAAHKTYWNDHDTEIINLYAKASSKVLNRPLLSIEKINLNALNDAFPFRAKKRELCRIVNWEGIKLNREGKHVQALQIWSNFHHTMALAIRGDAEIMDFFVDYAMLSIAQSGATYPDRDELKKTPEESPLPLLQDPKQIQKQAAESKEKRINGFIAYAQKYNRPDLAKQIKDDAQESNILPRVRTYRDNSTQNFDSEFRLLQISDLLTVAGITLIFSLLGALFAWLLLTGFRCFLFHKDGTLSENAQFPWWEKVKVIATCSGVFSCVGGIIAIYAVINMIASAVPQDQQYDLISGWGLVNTISNSNSFLDITDTLLSGEITFILWRLFVFLTPLILGSTYILYKRNERTEQKSFWKNLGKILFLLLLFSVCSILVLTTPYTWRQIAVISIAIVFLIISMFWMYRKSRRVNTIYGLQLFQSSLAGWACTTSILILAILIGQTLLDKRLQPWADNQLHGEMRQLHHVIDEPSQYNYSRKPQKKSWSKIITMQQDSKQKNEQFGAIHPQTRIGHVHLKVANLERALDFYCGVLGFELTQRYGAQAAFISAGGYHHHIGLNTWESAGGPPPPAGTTGLYHLAILYPTRAALADALRRLLAAGIQLDGASDHGVSEALYLRDPDQNGVELYWDRPREEWPRMPDGGVEMYTKRLDLEDLLNG